MEHQRSWPPLNRGRPCPVSLHGDVIMLSLHTDSALSTALQTATDVLGDAFCKQRWEIHQRLAATLACIGVVFKDC